MKTINIFIVALVAILCIESLYIIKKKKPKPKEIIIWYEPHYLDTFRIVQIKSCKGMVQIGAINRDETKYEFAEISPKRFGELKIDISDTFYLIMK